jgi:hypothetical protein
MDLCTDCGTALPDQACFCTSCGAPTDVGQDADELGVEEVQASADVESVDATCSNCAVVQRVPGSATEFVCIQCSETSVFVHCPSPKCRRVTAARHLPGFKRNLCPHCGMKFNIKDQAGRERDRQKAEDKAKRQAQKAEEQFRASPIGQATTAFDEGDGFFEIMLPISQTRRTMFAPGTYDGYSVKTQRSGSHGDLLSRIEAIGWRLEHVGYVFQMQGSVSRDKLLSSGQETGITGAIMGVYLFRRFEDAQSVAG